LRAAHIHNRGSFYAALFNLTIGIERLFKVVVVIDYMLDNNMTVLSRKQLKNRGHNIVTLYGECHGIAQKRSCPLPSLAQLDNIDCELLSLLSDFATTNRYYNLDSLGARSTSSDPLARLDQLLERIICQDVSLRKKRRILHDARLSSSLIDPVTLTVITNLDKSPLSTFQALSLPALHEQAVRYCILRLIKLLAPIKKLIEILSHGVYRLGPVPALPQMHEFLDWLWDNRKYVLGKKKWR
jgi:hypothetical protein